MAARSIFAVEMCLRFEPGVASYLQGVVRSGLGRASVGQKWHMVDQASRCLLHHRGLWSSGCWDFFDEDAKARADFNMWVHGMLSEEGARPAPLPITGDPYRGGERFMTFTMAALVVKGSLCERQLAHACHIPEADLWRTATFERILTNARCLNFANVEGSTMYVIPRDPEFALTAEDLRHPKFAYLRPIV